jgi:hypothetical protein
MCYGLMNGTISNSDNTRTWTTYAIIELLVSNEVESTWKEVIVIQFAITTRNRSEVTEGNHEKHHSL